MANNRAWFSYVNHLETATLTADSEVASLPVTNVVNRLTHKIFRSQSETVTISAEWASAITWQVLVIGFTPRRDPASTAVDSIDPTDEITITASNVSAGATDLLNVTEACGVNRVRGYYAYVAASPITGRWLDVTIDATSRAGLAYVDVAYMWAGPLFQPSTNFNTGSSIDFPEESLVNVSPISGATYVESRSRKLGFDGLWSLIDPSELESWQAMQEECGVTHPLAFGLTDTGSLTRKAFIARFSDPIRFSFGQNGRTAARVSLTENR